MPKLPDERCKEHEWANCCSIHDEVYWRCKRCEVIYIGGTDEQAIHWRNGRSGRDREKESHLSASILRSLLPIAGARAPRGAPASGHALEAFKNAVNAFLSRLRPTKGKFDFPSASC